MTNKEIAQNFSLLGKLVELHDNNTFKARSYNNATFRIKKLDGPLADMDPAAIAAQPGFGKAIQTKIAELLATGELQALNAYLEKTPPGILEILGIKGLGAKKVAVIWRELGVESPGELLYACRENRLSMLKGFGAKTQQSVIEAIEFWQQQDGLHHWANLEQPGDALLKALAALASRVEPTGAYRRKTPILQRIELLATSADGQLHGLAEQLLTLDEWTEAQQETKRETKGEATDESKSKTNSHAKNEAGSEQPALHGLVGGRYPATIHLTTPESYERRWFETTAAEAHLATLPDSIDLNAGDEAAIYGSAGLAWISPELREGEARVNEVGMARENKLPTLLEPGDIRGVVHNHSTYSDGGATVENMAKACIERGYDYLVMSDHSRTAVYAGGLPIERVEQQWREIDKLNEKLAPFRIYKSIESDILSDGSLDYPDDILAGFDMVVASVHSGLKMDQARATERLLAAIANPYTTILGHPTGRLLLSRPGYPLDHEAIIAACAKHGVVIEVNANPWRLDLDWTWIPTAMEAGVPISINPDAHALGGIDDIRFGVYAARKGGLTAEACWNTQDQAGINAWLEAKLERRAAPAS